MPIEILLATSFRCASAVHNPPEIRRGVISKSRRSGVTRVVIERKLVASTIFAVGAHDCDDGMFWRKSFGLVVASASWPSEPHQGSSSFL